MADRLIVRLTARQIDEVRIALRNHDIVLDSQRDRITNAWRRQAVTRRAIEALDRAEEPR